MYANRMYLRCRSGGRCVGTIPDDKFFAIRPEVRELTRKKGAAGDQLVAAPVNRPEAQLRGGRHIQAIKRARHYACASQPS